MGTTLRAQALPLAKENSTKTKKKRSIYTSSPIIKTFGSADISSSRAEFRASRTVIYTQVLNNDFSFHQHN